MRLRKFIKEFSILDRLHGEFVGQIVQDAFDVSTTSFKHLFDIAPSGSNPQDIFFKPDGTKMFIAGVTSSVINEYALSAPWDVTTASFTQAFSVLSEDTGPSGVFFKPDGTKMFVIGRTGKNLYQYDLSVAWDVSTAVLSFTFDVSTQDSAPLGIFFRPDGLKMFVMGSTTNRVYEFDLSAAWSISSAVVLQSFLVSAQETTGQDVAFSTDGTKMYIVGSVNDTVFQYDLSTAWDVTSAVFSESFSVSSEEALPAGMFFRADGAKLYVVGPISDNANEYNIGSVADESLLIFPSFSRNRKTGFVSIGKEDFKFLDSTVVKTPIAIPAALSAWLLIHVEEDVPEGTSLELRLVSNTGSFYWNGTTWAPSITEFNTLDDVNANIASWPFKELGVAVKLSTTDSKISPSFGVISALWQGKFNHLDDLIYRTLVPTLESIRPVVDAVVKTTAAGVTIVIPSDVLTGIVLDDVIGAFNLETDPEKTTNLLSSFDKGTRTVTLTASVPIDQDMFFEMEVVPQIVVTENQDFTEVAHLPSISIEGPTEFSKKEAASGPAIINKTAGTATRLNAPLLKGYRFTLVITTPGGVDQQRVVTELQDKLDVEPRLRSVGLDEYYDLRVSSHWSADNTRSLIGQHDGRMEIEVTNVPQWVGLDEEIPLVQQVVLNTRS